MIAASVFVIGTIASFAFAGLLLRGYLRIRLRLLLWCLLCFAGLALNNVLLVVDQSIDADISTWRVLPAAAGVAALVCGLIWDEA